MKKYEKRFTAYILFFLLLIAAISLGAVLFIGSAYFASQAKKYLSVELSGILQKKVTIKKIRISIFSPQVRLYGLSINDAAKITQINISFGPFDFIRRKIIIYGINIINPSINILVKNNKINNYKKINSVIAYFAGKHPSSFISVYLEKLKITGGNLNFNDADKNILLKLKNFNFTFYKKPGLIPFLYNGNGIYFKYGMPYIFFRYEKFNLPRVFSSKAFKIHYFNGFLRYRNVSFGNSGFKTMSNGVLDLRKNSPISAIANKINDTTEIKVGRLSYISENFTALPSLKGKMQAKASVIGDFYGKIRTSAFIRLAGLNFSGGDIEKGTVQCSGNFDLGKVKSGILKFNDISLDMFGGNLKSKGAVNFKSGEGKFKSVLKNIDAGKLIDFYDSEKIPQFKAIAGGNVKTVLHFGKKFYISNIEKIELKRPVEQLKYRNGKGATTVYYINYRNSVLISGETLINDESVLLKNTKITSKILNGTAAGEINYDKSYLNIGFSSTYRELPEVGLFEEYKSRYFEPSASGYLKGRINGKFGGLSYSFENIFNSLNINRYSDTFEGNAAVNIMPDGEVLFKKVFLKEKKSGNSPDKSKKGTATFGGEIFENKILKKEYINGNFTAKDIHLICKKPLPAVSLSFDSSGTISGELKDPVLKIDASSKKADVYGQEISDADAKFLIAGGGLAIKSFEGFYGSAPFKVYGDIKFKASGSGNSREGNNYNLRLISNRIDLSALNFKLLKKYRVKGAAGVNLHVGGSFDLPDVSGNVSADNIYINDFWLGNAAVYARSLRSGIALNISALKNGLKAKAYILLKKGYPYNFTANINMPDIKYRKTLFKFSGYIYGGGKILDIKKSYIFSKLNRLYLKHGPFFLKNTQDIDISYNGGALNLSGLKLRGADNYFQLKGGIKDDRYDVILNDKTDLWVLRLFSDKIMNSSGFVTASAVVFGPLSAPSLYGFADINKGLIEPSANPEYEASRIFARLSFNNNVISLNKAKFRLLNGIFSANGIIRLKNFKPYYYNVKTDFNSAVYRKSNYFFAKMDGELGFSGEANDGVLYGNINIKKASYDKRINLSSFLLSYKKYNIIKPVIKKGEFNPRLNIEVTSDGGIAIQNNIINTSFSANLNLIGTVYAPVLIGTANAEKGEIYFRGAMFDLSYANLDFNNRYRIAPSFDVSATTHMDRYIIRMNANGSLSDFNVNLSSTPPLSELDIVSMLALGAPSTSVYAGSAGGIAASEAVSAIGGGVEQSVTGAISSYFGFKNLSIAPSYSVITHSAAPQVTVTKTLTKRLSVSYNNIISSQSSQSLMFTYKLSRHISAIGEWENNELAPNNSNIYSEVGGNIVFHFRFY